jgi:hypothetical protein
MFLEHYLHGRQLTVSFEKMDEIIIANMQILANIFNEFYLSIVFVHILFCSEVQDAVQKLLLVDG